MIAKQLNSFSETFMR